MIELKNTTGKHSIVGQLVSSNTKSTGFIYATIGSNPIGVVTEKVPQGKLCKIATSGDTAKVFLKGKVSLGDKIRMAESSDNAPRGYCVPIGNKSGYTAIGVAVEAGTGLVNVSLNIDRVKDTSSFLTAPDIAVNTITEYTSGSGVAIGIGSNNTTVESDGTLTFNGDATVWDDLRVPMSSTKINATKSEPAFEEFTDGLFVYKFDTSNADDESLHFVAQIPHSYKVGTNLYPHLHWSPDSTNTGNVRWQFEYVISSINGTFPSTASSETITDAADGTTFKHQITDFTPIDGTGVGISAMIICRLTRLSQSDAADTYTGNACALEFDFHYMKDTVGSREEYIK